MGVTATYAGVVPGAVGGAGIASLQWAVLQCPRSQAPDGTLTFSALTSTTSPCLLLQPFTSVPPTSTGVLSSPRLPLTDNTTLVVAMRGSTDGCPPRDIPTTLSPPVIVALAPADAGDTTAAQVAVGAPVGRQPSAQVVDCSPTQTEPVPVVGVYMAGFAAPVAGAQSFMGAHRSVTALTSSGTLQLPPLPLSSPETRALPWRAVGLSHNFSLPCSWLVGGEDYTVGVYLRGALGGASTVVFSPPFRVVTRGLTGTIAVTTALVPPLETAPPASTGMVHVTWTLTSPDPVFGAFTTVPFLHTAVHCSWSVQWRQGQNAPHGPNATSITAVNASFDIPAAMVAVGVDNQVVVTCRDRSQSRSRVLVGASPPFRVATLGPHVATSSLVVSLGGHIGGTGTTSSYRACGLVSGNSGPGESSGGSTASTSTPLATATTWALASPGAVFSTASNITLSWAGAVTSPHAPLVKFVTTLRLGQSPIATTTCGQGSSGDGAQVTQVAQPQHPCTSATFPASVVWQFMQHTAGNTDSPAAPALCVPGPVSLSLSVTNSAGLSATVTTREYVLDATPPEVVPSCVVVRVCDADTATSTLCDSVSVVPPPPVTALAAVVNASCVEDAENVAGLVLRADVCECRWMRLAGPQPSKMTTRHSRT